MPAISRIGYIKTLKAPYHNARHLPPATYPSRLLQRQQPRQILAASELNR